LGNLSDAVLDIEVLRCVPVRAEREAHVDAS